ncbi:MAG: recombinase family protein [Chloroflexi bacterium]|nr:recombinase family protein [Chloroflexota bacterium]
METNFRGRIRPKTDSGPPSVRLACKRLAFVYQRLSTTEQKKNSRYSLERQDDLKRMAQEDGYSDELVHVERRDLGVSGTLGQEEREGLAYLIHLIEQDQVESVYVIEISRISRDQTLIDGLQFGELCRKHDVIIVTPTMRLNLRDEMHLRMYRYEIDRAAEELKSIRSRMQGAKNMKARHGYAVGGSLPTGYILDTDEKLPDGSLNPNHQKYKIYEPHAQVVRTLFQMMAKPGAYFKAIALECKRNSIVFPPIPDELRVTKGNATAFSNTPTNADGSYPISLSRIETILTNPAYIGWFLWSGEVISKTNHAPIIDEETFWTVQKKTRNKGFKRTELHDPMPLAGLLHCTMHPSPRRMIGSNMRERAHANYRCVDKHYEETCAIFTSYLLDGPIAELVISQCSFPQYSEQVLDRLTQEYDSARDKAATYKREYHRILDEIENLKANLTRTRTPKQVDVLLELIDAKLKEKERLASLESQPMGQVLSAAEVKTVKEFLSNLATGWEQMTDAVKNTFLSLLLERIDIIHNVATITATVTWRTGLKQTIRIERSFVDLQKTWTKAEDDIVRPNYASMEKAELCKQLPGRTWGSIRWRGRILGIDRPLESRLKYSSSLPYSPEEDQIIRDFHAFKITREEMRERLAHRSDDSVWLRGKRLGLRRREQFAKWCFVPDDESPESGTNGDREGTLEVITDKSRSKTRRLRLAARRARSVFRRILCSSPR